MNSKLQRVWCKAPVLWSDLCTSDWDSHGGGITPVEDNLADKATNNHKNLRIIEVSIAQSPSLW